MSPDAEVFDPDDAVSPDAEVFDPLDEPFVDEADNLLPALSALELPLISLGADTVVLTKGDGTEPLPFFSPLSTVSPLAFLSPYVVENTFTFEEDLDVFIKDFKTFG